MNIKFTSLLLLSLAHLSACAPVGIAETDTHIPQRVHAVREHKTLYTDSLVCFGEQLGALNDSGEAKIANIVFSLRINQRQNRINH